LEKFQDLASGERVLAQKFPACWRR